MSTSVWRSQEFSQCNRSSSMLLKVPSIPLLCTWFAVDLMLPEVSCISWHHNKGAWVQVNRDLCRLTVPFLQVQGVQGCANGFCLAEVHHASWLKRDYCDSIIKAHQINMGADTLGCICLQSFDQTTAPSTTNLMAEDMHLHPRLSSLNQHQHWHHQHR